MWIVFSITNEKSSENLGGVMEFSNVYWDTNKGIFLPGPAGERRDVSKVYTVETRLLLGLEG